MEEIEINNLFTKKAVTIEKAFKRFALTTIVLNGLHLTVEEGTIYALLGPSGCGKTTLLKCIVGVEEMDAGSIELKVTKRAEIGYMPQFLNLQDKMTIFENFYSYGYLFGMTNRNIKSRAKELIEFLNLPSGNRCISTLSGGQQRRLSIATALIHDPKLIILDEPTVGLDPLLSQSVWDCFQEMTRKGKTIIISTHYIQEAVRAHKVGLMRNGVLVAEESPYKLMEKYNCSYLEDAFLALCHEQIDNTELKFPEPNQHVRKRFTEDYSAFSGSRFFAIMYKNLTLLKQDILFMALLLLVPVLQIYLFFEAVGKQPTNLQLAVINEEIPLTNCPPNMPYTGCLLNQTQSQALSCAYLEFLHNTTGTYKFIEYEDVESAKHALKHDIWGLLHFNENYTRSLASRLRNETNSAASMSSSIISIQTDETDMYTHSFIENDATYAMKMFLEQIFINCGVNPKYTRSPITFQEPVYGKNDQSFINYAAPTMLCICSFVLPCTLICGLILSEKLEGTIERMMVAGANILEMFTSTLLIQMISSTLQSMFTIIFVYYIFEIPLKGSIVTLSALCLVTEFCGALFGITIAVMCTKSSHTIYIDMNSNMVAAMVSGMIWPIEAQHSVLRSINWLFPLTWPSEAIRGISSKGFTFKNIIVVRGFGSMVVWSVIFITTTCLLIKYKKNVWAARA